MPAARPAVAALLLATIALSAATGTASAATPLADLDTRARDSGPVAPESRRARSALEQRLGDEAVVTTDRITGAMRLVARTDGFLTGRSGTGPAAVALGYVRARVDAFGLDAGDLDGLRPTSRYTSAGITHLAWVQTHRGIDAYDNVLMANVADGRLLNVGGALVDDLRVDSIMPRLDALQALAVARREVGGVLVPPRATRAPGPERLTRFAGGDSARLTLFNDGTATRLAWRVVATGEHGFVYEVVVDAAGGEVHRRRSLTAQAANASIYRNHPGAAAGGTPETVDLAPWLSNPTDKTRLSGNNARARADTDATDGGDVDVPAAPPDQTGWVYPLTPFTELGCTPDPCTWNAADPSTRATNRNQATTQLFWFVNRFHDHLHDPPIDFTHQARGFELVDADGAGPGLGGDPVLAETDNYDNPDAAAGTPTSLNNASMTTLPDGDRPRLEVFLFGGSGIASRNSADAADVVYHEYTHGLTNRSVGTGIGLDADQSRALGEGWSDWYALDLLVADGLVDDSGADGELQLGAYLLPDGFRRQGLDCPVGGSAPACPGTSTAGLGGFTLGDMGRVGSAFEVHDDGEIWGETLWDLRSALDVATARRLVTEGLRLAPNNPSFLEARNAILQADQALGGTRRETLWQVFAARGMGYRATTTSSAATTAVESFDVAPQLVHDATTVDDGGPGGDADGVPEPGETVSLGESLRNPTATTATDIAGTLSSNTLGVPQPAATWPEIDAGVVRTGAPPFEVAIPAGADCDSTAQLTLAVKTAQSGPFKIPLELPIGSVSSADVPHDVPEQPADATSTLTFAGSGPVHGLELRIDNLTHSWVGDLVVKLTSPTGMTRTLIDRPGAGAEGASGDNLVDVVLDDDAATPIEDLPGTHPPGGYMGRFRPVKPLSDFDGQPRDTGPWTLTVIDEFPGFDAGTLHGWGIRPSDTAACNRVPVAVDDAYTSAPGQTLHAGGILANDSDPDGDPLTAVKASDPAHGSLTLAEDGSFAYTPAAGFRGADAFTYRARDGEGLPSAPATVRISVGNAPPIAAPDAVAALEGTPLQGPSVLANDSDPNGDALSATLLTPPAHGTLSLAADGTFSYLPQPNFTGRDAFVYRAFDGTDHSAPATVAIEVVARPVEGGNANTAGPVPTKLQVLRAGVSRGRLDVLARTTALATGSVTVVYHSAGRRTRFSAPIQDGRIRFERLLPAAQRHKSTGIVTLTYAGNRRVRPDEVRLRAANGKALLTWATTRIDGRGRLVVRGTISRRARGVVRIRLGYERPDGSLAFARFSAPIRAGAWSLARPLPEEGARAGGQLSIQFTGYEPLRIRGEQLAKAVRPPG